MFAIFTGPRRPFGPTASSVSRRRFRRDGEALAVKTTSLRSNPDMVNLSTKASSFSRLCAAPTTSRTTTTSLSEGGSCSSRVMASSFDVLAFLVMLASRSPGADGSQISPAVERLQPRDTGRKTDRRQGADVRSAQTFRVGARSSESELRIPPEQPHHGTSMSSKYRTPARFPAVAAFCGLLWRLSAEEQPTRARRTCRRFWSERHCPHRRRPPCFRS